MAQQLSDAPTGLAKLTDLKTRTMSAAGIGAVAITALWFGGVWSTLLIAAAAAAMAWEWRAITLGGGAAGLSLAGLTMLACVGAVLGAHWFSPAAVLIWLAVLTLAVAATDVIAKRNWRWGVGGILYLGLACAAFVMLRDEAAYGFATVLWIVLVVVGTDIGGYFAGRLIGGPKLAPRISPKKTWAGLGGGMALAFLIGGIFSWLTTGTYAGEVCTVSAAAAIVSQMGDIAESWVKRRFRVKDASNLIPGHGGVLDRADGLLAATLVAAAITFMRGQAVFIW